MIINLMDNIADVLKNNDNKSNSIEMIKKEIEVGLNALDKYADEIIYRISEKTHIKIYPLLELGNLFNDTSVRETKDFNKIHKFNSLKQEHDEMLKKLRTELDNETLELLNKFIDISENKPLFAIVMIERDIVKPKVLHENIGVFFESIYQILITYLSSLGVVIE